MQHRQIFQRHSFSLGFMFVRVISSFLVYIIYLFIFSRLSLNTERGLVRSNSMNEKHSIHIIQLVYLIPTTRINFSLISPHLMYNNNCFDILNFFFLAENKNTIMECARNSII